MVLGLISTMFNVPFSRSISLSSSRTSLAATFLAIDKPFLQQELPTTINQIHHP